MADSLEAHTMQKQMDDMNKMLLRVIAHLARTTDGQTSLILRDLTQISGTMSSLKQGIKEYLSTYQRQVGALVGVGSAINSSLGLKRVLEMVMDSLVALMGAANLIVAFNFPTDTWVNFKLFGGMGLMLVFVVGQSLMLAKYIEEEKK